MLEFSEAGELRDIQFKLVVAMGLILLQLFFHYPLGRVGDGYSPIYLPLMFTVGYAVWSRDYLFSFFVGVFSMTTFPVGVFIFYLQTSGRLIYPTGIDLLWTLGLILFSGIIGVLTVKLVRELAQMQGRA